MAARRHVMTPARKAALKKAQAASARKRRGKGKGKLAAANRQLSVRRSSRGRRIAGAVGQVAAVVAVTYAADRVGRSLARQSVSKSNKVRSNLHASRSDWSNLHTRKVKHFSARPASGPPNRHNRVFVATRRGTVHVRKRGN